MKGGVGGEGGQLSPCSRANSCDAVCILKRSEYTYLVSIRFCSILCSLDLVKVILVKLTDKACKVVVLKMLRQNDLGELIGLFDDKRLTTLAPGDNWVMLLFFEHSN